LNLDDDILDPSKPLYENSEVTAVRLRDGDVLQFERGTYRELKNANTDQEIFVGQLSLHPSHKGKNYVAGPSNLIELVYFRPDVTE
jgi:hypothetical protein